MLIYKPISPLIKFANLNPLKQIKPKYRFNIAQNYVKTYNFNHLSSSQPPQTIHFGNINAYYFSKIKKNINQKLVLSKKLINKQQNGYVIYDSSKNKQFKVVSIIIIAGIVLTAIKMIFTQAQFGSDQYVILTFLCLGFFIYQRRVTKTLKKVIIQPKGLQIVVKTHSFMGIQQNWMINKLNQRITNVPIQLMNGIGKGTSIGGNVIQVGGKYDFKQMKFWFSRKYILNREVFEKVVNGNHVTFKDQFQIL